MEKEQIIKELQKNAETIAKTLLPNALNRGEDSKYKNLINGLHYTLDLIDRYGWQLMWTKFRDGNGKQFVSIWEQNINNEIRNNQVFAVDEAYEKIGGKRYAEKVKVILDDLDDVKIDKKKI